MEVRRLSPFISTEISGVPLGVSAKVHVQGQNKEPTTQRLGIHWIVKDPNGVVVEDYEWWELWPHTSPDATQDFSGDDFDLNVLGTWTIIIGLSMNPDNPVIVDTYDGVLVVVSQLAGTIVKKELEYDETRGDIPVQ